MTLTLLRDGKETSVMVTLVPARPRRLRCSEQTELIHQPQSGVFLGIGGVPMTAELARSLDLPEDTQGVLVQEVTADSPADDANLQTGDIITALDREAVEDVQGLRDMIQQHQAGDEVTLTILRDGEEMQVQVTLATGCKALSYR